MSSYKLTIFVVHFVCILLLTQWVRQRIPSALDDANSREKTGSAYLIFLSSVWLGCVLAISFTESWVKFKSQLLYSENKYIGLDIGRNVFSALNSLDLAYVCNMLFAVQAFVGAKKGSENFWTAPVCLFVMVIFQTFYLTPILDVSVNQKIVDALKVKRHATKQDEKIYKEAKVKTQLSKSVSPKFHSMYVALEVLKVGGLLYYIVFNMSIIQSL